jgi:anaerobic ribonucleoside-triphosphate reductase activating protein
MMKVAKTERYDLVNTPGESKPAFTIWFAGCSMKCDGCYNPSLWDTNRYSNNKPSTIVMAISRDCVPRGIDTVVLLGGEPLELDHGELLVLCKRLYADGYKIWLYTGWNWDDIPTDLLKYLYTIKYGKYDKALAVRGFPASSNQGVKRVGADGVWKSITIGGNT